MPKPDSAPPPSLPSPSQVWWVAVQGAQDASGGWIVLADESETGARQIQQAFARARIPILATVDAQSLAQALTHPSSRAGREHSVVWVQDQGATRASVVPFGSAQALVNARLDSPTARIHLAQSQDQVEILSRRLLEVATDPRLPGVRLDLRSPPAGQGAWGLAELRRQAL